MKTKIWIISIILILILLVNLEFNLGVSKQNINNSASSGYKNIPSGWYWDNVGVLVMNSKSKMLTKIIEEEFVKDLKKSGFNNIILLSEENYLHKNEIDIIFVVIPSEYKVGFTPLVRKSNLSLEIKAYDVKNMDYYDFTRLGFQLSWAGNLTEYSYGVNTIKWVTRNMVKGIFKNSMNHIVTSMNKASSSTFLSNPEDKKFWFNFDVASKKYDRKDLSDEKLDQYWIHPKAENIHHFIAERSSGKKEVIYYTVKLPQEEVKTFLKEKISKYSSGEESWYRIINGYWGTDYYSSEMKIDIAAKLVSEINFVEEKELKEKVITISIEHSSPIFVLHKKISKYQRNNQYELDINQLYQEGRDLTAQYPDNSWSYYVLGKIAIQKIKEEYVSGVFEIEKIEKIGEAIYQSAEKFEKISGYSHFKKSQFYYDLAVYFANSELMSMADESLKIAGQFINQELLDYLSNDMRFSIAATHWYSGKDYQKVLDLNTDDSTIQLLQVQIYFLNDNLEKAEEILKNNYNLLAKQFRLAIELENNKLTDLATAMGQLKSNYSEVEKTLLLAKIANYLGEDASPFYQELAEYPAWKVRDTYQKLYLKLGEWVGVIE
ncbi:MAG: hypothetical protein KAX49_08155 [Halanaerobiales bacterium]|nr:hypothetical protein [Halanaerobiales bacterium]